MFGEGGVSLPDLTTSWFEIDYCVSLLERDVLHMLVMLEMVKRSDSLAAN